MNQDQQVRIQTLKDNMDYDVLNESPSAKGFADKVLQSKIDGGDTKQLEANLRKFEAAEQYCRDRERELSIELKGINKQIRKLNEGEALHGFVEAEDAFFKSVIAVENAWVSLKEAGKKCHSFGMNYQFALQEHGIDDPVIFKILSDVLRPNVIGFKKHMNFLDEMSGMKLLENNRYFIPPGRLNERRVGERKQYDRRRDNFK